MFFSLEKNVFHNIGNSFPRFKHRTTKKNIYFLKFKKGQKEIIRRDILRPKGIMD
jgi:hypothetical protein